MITDGYPMSKLQIYKN